MWTSGSIIIITADNVIGNHDRLDQQLSAIKATVRNPNQVPTLTAQHNQFYEKGHIKIKPGQEDRGYSVFYTDHEWVWLWLNDSVLVSLLASCGSGLPKPPHRCQLSLGPIHADAEFLTVPIFSLIFLKVKNSYLLFPISILAQIPTQIQFQNDTKISTLFLQDVLAVLG